MLVESDAVAKRRLAAYRNSVFGNLTAALQAAYPITARIVGTPFFREAARQFILATPSDSGDLNEFGAHFDQFVATYPHASDLPYLPDVAHLEWLVQQVFYAPDAPSADLRVLNHVNEARYGDLCFTLPPACARIDSRWPLGEIWRVNQVDYAGDLTVDFSRGAQLLITRHAGLVRVETIAPATAAFFDTLAAQATLAVATSDALAIDGQFELAKSLSEFVAQGLLLRAHLPGQAET